MPYSGSWIEPEPIGLGPVLFRARDGGYHLRSDAYADLWMTHWGSILRLASVSAQRRSGTAWVLEGVHENPDVFLDHFERPLYGQFHQACPHIVAPGRNP